MTPDPVPAIRIKDGDLRRALQKRDAQDDYDSSSLWWILRALEERKPKWTRKRKPTLAGVAKQAAKANIPVAAYEVRPDGTIGVVVGTPNEAKPDSDNPWDKVLRNAPH